MIAGTHKSEKPINIMGVDKVHLKADCIQGSIVNGCREATLFFFLLVLLQVKKYTKNQESDFLKKKSVLSHITFYLEDDDHQPVDFHNETINFTCQIKKFNK